jgi:tetratricopeptide (TPR) repeat protein
MSEKINKKKIYDAQPLFIKSGLPNNKKYSIVRQQPFHQRYFSAELLRQTGNSMFKKGKPQEAATFYEEALAIFRFIKSKRENWQKEGIFDEDLTYVHYTGNNQKEKQILDSMKLSLYLNLAACYLKLSDNDNAIKACDEALLLESRNTKALFRRARARSTGENVTMQSYNAALEDIKLAYEINNDSDPDIKDELIRITNEYYEALHKARELQLMAEYSNDPQVKFQTQ